MIFLVYLVVTLALCGPALSEDPLSVRVVTWNVLSNKWMGGKFDPQAVKELLGPMPVNVTFNATRHDVVVVALQENCFMCNKGNEQKLAQVFLTELQKTAPYEFVASAKTRNSRSCEWWACKTFQHGTAAIMVFARPGLLRREASPPVVVNGCDGWLIHNEEKGIAGIRTIVQETGQSLCFAGLHLDSKKHEKRRECLEKFWGKAREQTWRDCDATFMMGDFNTRPGPNKDFFPGSVDRSAFGDEFFLRSWSKDEMVGVEPWGGKRLIDFITKHSGYEFEEQDVKFMPTYSIQPRGSCQGQPPCFKGSRQPAWTDRILCANCQASFYDTLHLGKSDHDPVVGVFEV